MEFQNPHYLVETDWLQANLDDPNLRIFDCTVFMPNYDDDSAADGLEIVSGRAHWEQEHIPGSAFADMLQDVRDPNNAAFMLAMPSAEQFSAVMSRYGIGDGVRVVLYDSQANIWATRFWWTLRYFGFDNAAVLNGGWIKWVNEGRAISTEASNYAPAKFNANPNPALIATKEEVQAAVDNQGTCLINALDADEHAGRGPIRYGRPGHIPSSVNVSFLDILDLETFAYLKPEQLHERFTQAGVLNKDRVITYCGGGIAATGDAFILTLLGVHNVAVYDGSLTEWAADPTLPLVIGDG